MIDNETITPKIHDGIKSFKNRNKTTWYKTSN